MKKYHKLETYDWRDNRHFFGTSEEFEDYKRTGCYLLDDHSLGTRYHDGYQASDATLIAGPKDGWYSESGAFITRCPGEIEMEGLHRYDEFPLNKEDKMKDTIFIILYRDGTMIPMVNEPLKEHFPEGTRFFKTNRETTISDLSGWYGSKWAAKRFKEIAGK